MSWNPSRKWLEELVANLRMKGHFSYNNVCVLEDIRNGNEYRIVCIMVRDGYDHFTCKRVEGWGPHPKHSRHNTHSRANYQLTTRIRDALIMAAWPDWSPPISWNKDDEH